MNDNLAYKEEPAEELIGGQVVLMAPAVITHNRIKNNIAHRLTGYLSGRRCEFLPDGTGLILAENEDEYIPDGMVVCDPEKVGWDAVHGAPDLVIEVLSPGTARNDRGRKKDMYERYGVREYWIVNPADRTLEQYVLHDGRFSLDGVYHKYAPRETARMKPEERDALATEFPCAIFDDLTVRLDDVFDRVAIE